jgi:hypothetical protein
MSTPHAGSGTTFSFGGTNFTVTNIVYTLTDVNAADTIDISHLGQSAGSAVLTLDRPLTGAANDTGREVQIDYIGSSVINDGSTGTLAITGGISLSKSATVSSSSVTLAVNDVIRGSATFRVAR